MIEMQEMPEDIKTKIPQAVSDAVSALLAVNAHAVIAIDGRAAAGKTTLAAALTAAFDAAVVHMDDFFLPPSLRTAERLLEPGGNVDYDRFAAEVLPPLADGCTFAYWRFDCSRMDFGRSVTVPARRLRIVEGSYAHHPRFGEYADLRIFLDIDDDTQRLRIIARNGAEKYAVFRDRWIPMENRYFQTYAIRQHADLLL